MENSGGGRQKWAQKGAVFGLREVVDVLVFFFSNGINSKTDNNR